MRKRRGMIQEQVAVRMGVSVAWVSQTESGDVSTQDVLSRFVVRPPVTPIAASGSRALCRTVDCSPNWLYGWVISSVTVDQYRI